MSTVRIKATDIGTGGAVLSHVHRFEQYGDHAPDDYGDPLAEWCPGCGRLRSDVEAVTVPREPRTPEPWTDADVADLAWAMWFARKVKGPVREVAVKALEQNPELRFSERERRAVSEARPDTGERRLLAELRDFLEDIGPVTGYEVRRRALLAALGADSEPPVDGIDVDRLNRTTAALTELGHKVAAIEGGAIRPGGEVAG